MRSFTRRLFLFAGVLCFLLAVTQMCLHVYQPYSMIGFRTHGIEEGYEVLGVAPGSPADTAGIKKGDVIAYLNGQDMGEFIMTYVKNKGFEETFTNTPYLYEKGETYICQMTDGLMKTFYIPEKAPFLYELGLMDRDNIIYFVTGGLFILLGIVITCLSAGAEGITDFILFLYTTGICIINSYTETLNTDFYSRMNIILYNLSCGGIALSLLRILGYFYRILGKEKQLRNIRIISNFPVIFICLEIVFMVTGFTSFYAPFGFGNPNLIGSVALIASLVYSLGVFFKLLSEIPRQSSLFLRFILMGICFGAFPALCFALLRCVNPTLEAGVNETLYTILPLLFIPISVFCSVFQSLKPKFDQIAAQIMAAAGTVIVLVLFTLIVGISVREVLVLMCFAPFVYLAIEKPVISFLYPKLDYVHRDFDSLEKKVFRCQEDIETYGAAADWLFTTLNARFVVFTKIKPVKVLEIEEILYKQVRDKTVDLTDLDTMIEERVNDRVHREGLLIHPGRGCSYPLYESYEIVGYVFVGSRSQYDQFSNMEMRLLEPMVRILMESMMMLRIKEQAEHVSDMQNQIVFSFADMIESRDGSTGLHVKRTSSIVDLLAQKLKDKGVYKDKLDSAEYEMISLAAPLHDIGKIKIPDAILAKPGKLTDEEFSIIKAHAVEGEKIISKTMAKIEDEKYLTIARDMALYHHEKWNGSGYPEGLSENAIPISARIMAVADVFDALCSARCYKKAFSIDEAFAILEESRGTHFEPMLVDVMKELRPELEIMYQQ